MLCLQYFYNIFTINFKWQVVIKGGQKDNLSYGFKNTSQTYNIYFSNL